MSDFVSSEAEAVDDEDSHSSGGMKKAIDKSAPRRRFGIVNLAWNA